jgi:hypothetical protein
MERYIDGNKTRIISEILFNFIKIICTSLLALILGYFLNIEMSLILEFVVLLNGTFGSYYILYLIMNRYLKLFREINPEHKKMYVIKNFTKSMMLANLCYLIPSHIWQVFIGNCDLYFMKRCAIHYVINDIVGLLVVKKLPKTTIIHHVTTTIFAFLTLLKTNNTIDIITLIEIYAMFSALAFCVNFYLGFRVFQSDGHVKKSLIEFIKKNLSLLSFVVYAVTCLFNWIVQIYLAYQLYFVSIWQLCVYFVFFYSVANDDVILMKWLYNDYTILANKK